VQLKILKNNSMEKPFINVMIVDDHEIFRNGLKMAVGRLKYAHVSAEADNGLDFITQIEKKRPDIVLMDIEMPVMNGIDATGKAMTMYPDLKIIALTMYKDDAYIQSMLEAGARGFLIKNITKDILDRAIQAVYHGKTYYSEELWDYFTKKVTAQEEDEEKNLNLTPRENEILQLLAEGLTNKEIANKLFLSERTVVGHKTNLLSKTNCKNTVSLLAFAIKSGLIHI
jgi:DNA-binding NarL/FixJ family response regulator